MKKTPLIMLGIAVLIFLAAAFMLGYTPNPEPKEEPEIIDEDPKPEEKQPGDHGTEDAIK